MSDDLLKQLEEESQPCEQIDLLKDAFLWVEKALRAVTIYTEDHNITRQFYNATAEKFINLTEELGDIWLGVNAKTLTFNNREVYREDFKSDGFVFAMYRDGIRRLCFRPGLTADEVLRFTQTLAVDLDLPEYFDCDRVTLLWDANLKHIVYTVQDLMSEIPEDDEDFNYYRNLLNTIIQSATQIHLPPDHLQAAAPQIMHIATEALAGLDPEKIASTVAISDGVDESLPEGEADSQPAREAILARLEDSHLVLKFSEILFRCLTQDLLIDRSPTLNTFDLLVLALIKGQRFSDLHRVLYLIRALGQQSFQGAVELSKKMSACLVKSERLKMVVHGLNVDNADEEAILAILHLTPPELCSEVLQAGAEIEKEELRTLVVKVLAKIVHSQPEILAKHLSSSALKEVQMAYQGLLSIGSEAALEALLPLQHHPQASLRLGLLHATKSLKRPSLRKMRLDLLDDETPRVRAEAEQILAEDREPELINRLFQKLTSGALKECSSAEKRRACEFLGRYGGERELVALTELVQRGKFFRGQQHLELCVAAAYGLAASGKPDHVELLKNECQKRLTSKVVKVACEEAISSVFPAVETDSPDQTPPRIKQTSIGRPAVTPSQSTKKPAPQATTKQSVVSVKVNARTVPPANAQVKKQKTRTAVPSVNQGGGPLLPANAQVWKQKTRPSVPSLDQGGGPLPPANAEVWKQKTHTYHSLHDKDDAPHRSQAKAQSIDGNCRQPSTPPSQTIGDPAPQALKPATTQKNTAESTVQNTHNLGNQPKQKQCRTPSFKNPAADQLLKDYIKSKSKDQR